MNATTSTATIDSNLLAAVERWKKEALPLSHSTRVFYAEVHQQVLVIDKSDPRAEESCLSSHEWNWSELQTLTGKQVLAAVRRGKRVFYESYSPAQARDVMTRVRLTKKS